MYKRYNVHGDSKRGSTAAPRAQTKAAAARAATARAAAKRKGSPRTHIRGVAALASLRRPLWPSRTDGRPPDGRPRRHAPGLARHGRALTGALAAMPKGARTTRACSACTRGHTARCHSPWGRVRGYPMVAAHLDYGCNDAAAEDAVKLEAGQPPATRAMKEVVLEWRLGWGRLAVPAARKQREDRPAVRHCTADEVGSHGRGKRVGCAAALGAGAGGGVSAGYVRSGALCGCSRGRSACCRSPWAHGVPRCVQP